MTIDVGDFQQEVIQKSHDTPVLVDFWAPWCGPCRVLGPVLEKLAAEASGSWVLAKLNTEEEPEVAMQYGIRGIPAVKLFVDGQVKGEFTGALPEHAVRRWLDEQLPSAEKSSLAQATSLMGEGRLREAQELLEDLDSDEAKILLARLIVFTNPKRASELIAEVQSDSPETRSIVEAVTGMAAVLSLTEDELPDGPGKPVFASAIDHLHSGRFEQAAAGLVSVLREDRFYGDDAARRVGVALFTLLGPDHPASRAHRRMFDMYLY